MRVGTARPLFVTALLASLLAQAEPGSAAIQWLAAAEIASGGGTKGAWRQNDSAYDYVDDGSAAFLPDGALAVAWVDQRRKDVFLTVLDPAGSPRGAAVAVSRNPASFSWFPRVVSPGPDTLYLLWQEIIFSGGAHGGDILFARSDDGGSSFSQPRNLSASRGGDGKGRLDRTTWSNGSLDIAAGLDGSVLAAWTEYDGMLWLARSRDGGRSFTPPRHIAGDARRPARGPALAVGHAGRLYLAWTVGEDLDADIRVSQSNDGGASFAPPVRVGAAGARADAPQIATDRDGGLHLVYLEQAGTQPGVVRYAYASGPELRFGTARSLSTGAEGASAAYLAVDGQGGVHAVWEPASRTGLWYAAAAGTGFSSPVLVPHSVAGEGGRNGSQQGILGRKLAVGADGTIAVVNSSLAPGRGSRVWVMRGQVVRNAR